LGSKEQHDTYIIIIIDGMVNDDLVGVLFVDMGLSGERTHAFEFQLADLLYHDVQYQVDLVPVANSPIETTKAPTVVRRVFNSALSRESCKVGDSEPLEEVFGEKLPPQSKTTVLTIFAFLGDGDLYRASLVCKQWSKLAIDKELWKFPDNDSMV
jgi:F-box-like